MARFWLIFFQPAEKLFSRKSAQRNECHSSLIVGMGIASYRGHKRNQLFPPQKLTGPSPSGWLFFCPLFTCKVNGLPSEGECQGREDPA